MDKREITYPQTFDLKVVVIADIPTDDTKASIELALLKSGVEHKFVNILASSKGRYLSYAYKVTVESRQQMECMYAEVRDVPGIKFVL